MSAFLIILMVAIICIISYERPIKMTAQNLNYYTIRATLDVFAQIESEHHLPIATLMCAGIRRIMGKGLAVKSNKIDTFKPA